MSSEAMHYIILYRFSRHIYCKQNVNQVNKDVLKLTAKFAEAFSLIPERMQTHFSKCVRIQNKYNAELWQTDIIGQFLI